MINLDLYYGDYANDDAVVRYGYTAARGYWLEVVPRAGVRLSREHMTPGALAAELEQRACPHTGALRQLYAAALHATR